MAKPKMIYTPIGPRKMSKEVEKLFETMPTVAVDKQLKGPEYEENGYKYTWFEKDGKLCTTICPA